MNPKPEMQATLQNVPLFHGKQKRICNRQKEKIYLLSGRDHKTIRKILPQSIKINDTDIFDEIRQ